MDNPQVKRLKDYLKAKHADKAKYEAELERAMRRQREVDAAPWEAKMDFYCRCHGDFVCIAGKVVCRSGWPDVYAYYVPKGGFKAMYYRRNGALSGNLVKPCKARRYITDKHYDPYYRQSPMVIRQQRQATAEGWFLQPGQAGFAAKYGDPYKQQYAELERQEKLKWITNNAK